MAILARRNRCGLPCLVRTGVFLLSSPHRDAVQWHRNAIDAARASGVDLLVRSSIIGSDRSPPAEFVSAHTQCDQYLEQVGLDYVILRPNLFLQNVPESNIPSVGADGSLYVNAGDARISMVDTRMSPPSRASF